MPRRLSNLLIPLVALLSALWPGGAAWAEGPPKHARVELRALPQRVVAGAPFWVGFVVNMDPGWHTYWQNPGGAGLPPKVDWKLPPGFAAGPVVYQRPKILRTSVEGGGGEGLVGGGEVIESYAYTDQTTYFTKITPPQKLAQGKVTLGAMLRFGVCAAQCFAQREELSLTLPVGVDPGEDDALLLAEQKLIPPPHPGAAAGYSLKTTPVALTPGKPATLTVTVVPGASQTGWGFDPVNWQEAEHGLLVGKTDFIVPGPPQYEGLNVRVPLEVVAGGPAGEITLPALMAIKGEGKSLAHTFEIKVNVAGTGKKTGAVPPPVTGADSQGAAPPPPPPGAAPAGHPVAAHDGHPALPLLLLMALVGGVLLNLMPCVLPVLSIKVLGFVNDAHGHAGNPLLGGLAYLLGVLASFGALAALVVSLAGAGRAVGWGMQFSNPFFVMVMAVVMLVFALNLFGAFELTFQGGGAAGLASKQGLAGSFLSGVLATTLATPCTAPFLSPVLGFALSQPGIYTFLLLLVMGLGLALPYVVLAAHPNLLRYVPKPGPWMLRFKQFMGLLLVATLLWLVWLMGQLWPGEGLLMLLVELFLVGVAVWCWGLSQMAPGASRWGWRGAVAALLVAAGLWTVVERPNPRSISPAAQMVEEGAWQPFSEKLLGDLRRQGKVVFVDFTADWCLTCKANKARVLHRGGFYQLAMRQNVALLVADWTHQPAPLTRFMARYGRSAVPLYLVFSPDQKQEAQVLPELLSFPVLEQAILAARAGEMARR